MKQSAITARKRELRERIAELMSKRGKIGKKNFGKSLERKKLTEEIKRLTRERASVCACVHSYTPCKHAHANTNTHPR